MTKRPDLDLTTASLDDLLAGLDGTPGREPHTIDLWIESEGYYPGTKRVPAADLHAKYLEWLATRPDLLPKARATEIRQFGKFMATRFKSGKSNRGTFYYISRERVVEIPHSLKAGGWETGGASNPVGPGPKPPKSQ